MGSIGGKKKQGRGESYTQRARAPHHIIKNKSSGETAKNKQTGRTTTHTNLTSIFFSADFTFLLNDKTILT